MIELSLALALALPTAAPVQVPAPPPVLQDEEEPEELPDGRDEVSELLDRLGDHAKKRGEEDDAAIAVIDELVQEFPRSGPRDRRSIVRELDKLFKLKRTKELEPGVPDNRLYMAAAVALREMGPESVDVLEKWIGHRSHNSDLKLQQALVESLGKTKDVDGVKTLTDLLKHKDPELQGAAAKALGEFGHAPQKVRKQAFEECLKAIMTVKGRMDSDPNDLEARDRYAAIAAPIITTLQVLSGHDERDPDQWQRWWNDNKKADWGDEEGGA